MISAVLLMALALAPDVTPKLHAQHDTYIRFERNGYYGNVYLNQDGSYVIVQTGADRITQTFLGSWVAHGVCGFCMQPQNGTPRKCFTEMPTAVGKTMSVRSGLDEVYLVSLRRER
jgi:hypothetical protein